MQTLQAVIVGAVQGLSEFLPISSSAHIVFSTAIYKLVTGATLATAASSEEVFFDICIHFATLLAIFIFFWRDIVDIVKGFFNGLFKRDFKNENFLMACFIVASTFVTGVLALIFKDFAESLVAKPRIVSLLLVMTGFILFASEKIREKNNEEQKSISWKSALIIGIAQGLAVFPGLSRSGLTIASAIFQGIDRVKAAKFSFLISVPIIVLASALYPLIHMDFSEIQALNYKAISLGMLTAFVSGYFCIKYFIAFLAKSTLKSFAYYCWIVGALMFALFSICRHL